MCAETSVVVYSSCSLRFPPKDSYYGFKLYIPEGSLPVGTEQCTINIKVSLAGNYGFPENSSLVSAIFWLCSKPLCKFTKPVKMEIQHCAHSEDSSKLSFVRAVCSQEKLPYIFKVKKGGDFTSHDSYGIIELNGFSAHAITHDGESVSRKYFSKLFYRSNYHLGHRIDLIFTWNTEAHIDVSLYLHIHQLYNECMCHLFCIIHNTKFTYFRE